MAENQSAEYWIKKLDLLPHPEGGYYREMYRSAEVIPHAALPSRFSGDRCFSTSIYFLLRGVQSSLFHRLQADEIWHFYTGSPLEITMISPKGERTQHHLGSDPERGLLFQVSIPACHWMAAEVVAKDSYSLVGCTVSPGFDYQDFEIRSK